MTNLLVDRHVFMPKISHSRACFGLLKWSFGSWIFLFTLKDEGDGTLHLPENHTSWRLCHFIKLKLKESSFRNFKAKH